MKLKTGLAPLLALGAVIALLALAACSSAPDQSTRTVEIPSGRSANASVTGTVTYNERLELTPDAKLIVQLRDVSYADAAAPLIASQTISNPGQVPIKFKVEYNRDDIDDRNTYGISARIIESDGRLAFINDTAYDVITRGNPNRVDMLLVLVEPPPDLIDEDNPDWRTWIEVPAHVISANIIPNEPETFLRVNYYQSTVENCARPGNQSLEVIDDNVVVKVTLMQPPPTAWSAPCDEELVELDTVERIEEPLVPEKTYRVIVNDQLTTTFTIPSPHLGHTYITESPIESWELQVLESFPPQYQLHVVSGMHSGSCTQFNGYEIRRTEPDRIEVSVTHHVIADESVTCTADYPIVETVVPLGADFQSGREYTVTVNSESEEKFKAQ